MVLEEEEEDGLSCAEDVKNEIFPRVKEEKHPTYKKANEGSVDCLHLV